LNIVSEARYGEQIDVKVAEGVQKQERDCQPEIGTIWILNPASL